MFPLTCDSSVSRNGDSLRPSLTSCLLYCNEYLNIVNFDDTLQREKKIISVQKRIWLVRNQSKLIHKNIKDLSSKMFGITLNY